MSVIIAVFLGLSALVVVCYPLLGVDVAQEAPESVDPLAEVADRETQAKRALREVDFDHRLGNLEESDYEGLRERYEQRALEALRGRYERERELDARIDRELAALRSGQASANGLKRHAAQADQSSRSQTSRAHSPKTPHDSRPRRRRGV
jgi:hypothetical protein